jgi:hypothetical protein
MLMAIGIPKLILGHVTGRGLSDACFHAAEFFCGLQNNEIPKTRQRMHHQGLGNDDVFALNLNMLFTLAVFFVRLLAKISSSPQL